MEHTNEEQRCISYSTAMGYPLKEIVLELRKNYRLSQYKEAVFVDYGTDPYGGPRGVFVFVFGTFVCWGLSRNEEEEILHFLKSYEEGSYEFIEKELLGYTYGEKGAIVDDCLILPSKDISVKLAYSFALAQSSKLAVFEGIVKKTTNATRFLPEQLSKHGRIPLSKKEIQKKMGELFIERSSINLHFDALDTPEYFWEHSELEPLYTITVNHLDIKNRVDLLNRRLDVMHDLLEVLDNELNHQHASRLEWIIILLIMIEVAISLVKFY